MPPKAKSAPLGDEEGWKVSFLMHFRDTECNYTWHQPFERNSQYIQWSARGPVKKFLDSASQSTTVLVEIHHRGLSTEEQLELKDILKQYIEIGYDHQIFERRKESDAPRYRDDLARPGYHQKIRDWKAIDCFGRALKSSDSWIFLQWAKRLLSLENTIISLLKELMFSKGPKSPGLYIQLAKSCALVNSDEQPGTETNLRTTFTVDFSFCFADTNHLYYCLAMRNWYQYALSRKLITTQSKPRYSQRFYNPENHPYPHKYSVLGIELSSPIEQTAEALMGLAKEHFMAFVVEEKLTTQYDL